MAILFKARALLSQEELDATGIEHDQGWVQGQFLAQGGKCFIVGEIMEVNVDHLVPSFIVAVDPSELYQIGYTTFDELCKEHGFFRAVLINSGMDKAEVEAMTEEEVEGCYDALISFI